MTPENWISIASLFVDIIKSVIPFGTLLIIFKVFKSEIKSVIKNKGIKVTAPGVSVETLNQQTIKPSVKKQKEIEELNKELKSSKEREDILKQIQENTSRDKETYFLGYHFEKTYRIIFPSQMAILKMLNDQGGEVTNQIAMAIFSRTVWAQKFNVTYESFMGFLIQSGITVYDPVQNKFSITNLGKLFWEYLNNNNIPLKIPATDTV